LEGRGFFPDRSRRHRLRRTHLNGNRGFRNAFLMRFAPWETVPRAADARPRHRLPVVWAWDELRRPHCASGLLAPRCAPRTAFRFVAGGADHPTILRSVPSFHEARQRNCHASCEPPPGGCLLDLCSASVGTPGRLRVGQVGWCRLAGARPRSIGAVPGKERERCSLSARRCAPVLR
jgi:hypothetical protein